MEKIKCSKEREEWIKQTIKEYYYGNRDGLIDYKILKQLFEFEPDEIEKYIEIGDNRLKQGFSISACEWYKEAITLQAEKIKELEQKIFNLEDTLKHVF